MRYKWGEPNFGIKSIKIIVDFTSLKPLMIESPTIEKSIESLENLTQNKVIVNIDIEYTNREHKKVNCDSVPKAIMWLKLNEEKTKE